ncbi:hypothetical protein D9M68_614220 [compost metagenome]
MAVIKHLLLPLLVICCLLEFETARASDDVARRTLSPSGQNLAFPTLHPAAD